MRENILKVAIVNLQNANQFDQESNDGIFRKKQLINQHSKLENQINFFTIHQESIFKFNLWTEIREILLKVEIEILQNTNQFYQESNDEFFYRTVYYCQKENSHFWAGFKIISRYNN